MRKGLLTGQVRLSLMLALAAGMVTVTLLGGCGKKDQENPDLVRQPQAMLPETEAPAAVGDTMATPVNETATGAGTLPDAEGVSGVVATGKQAVPVAAAQLKAVPTEPQVSVPTAGTRPATSVSSGGSGFSLQLGSFTNLANARKQVDRINALGYKPVIEASDLGGQTYHRVMLKGVGDMAEASRLGEYIHSELGIAYLVRRGE